MRAMLHNSKHTIMPAMIQTQNMTPVIQEKNTCQPKLLVYKPMPVEQEKIITAWEINKTGNLFPCMCLAIPFQPSMWDEKSIHAVWKNGMELAKEKLKVLNNAGYSDAILARLEVLLPRLNYNTHRKSLAIILTPAEEKLLYLSFPVQPAVFLNNAVSLLDLAANMQQEAAFYYLILHEKSASLYNYNNKQLCKVYEQRNETCPEILFKNAASTVELMNCNYENPVFVNGSPTMVERFYNSSAYSKEFFTLLYHTTPFSVEIIPSLVKEIATRWNYWQLKFIKAKILLARQTGRLVSHFDAVLKALRKCTDGVLLVDEQLKCRLQTPGMESNNFPLANDFMQQVENFLVRGNRIEIAASGSLKEMGGIVLLQEHKPGNTYNRPAYRNSGTGGSLY